MPKRNTLSNLTIDDIDSRPTKNLRYDGIEPAVKYKITALSSDENSMTISLKFEIEEGSRLIKETPELVKFDDEKLKERFLDNCHYEISSKGNVTFSVKLSDLSLDGNTIDFDEVSGNFLAYNIKGSIDEFTIHYEENTSKNFTKEEMVVISKTIKSMYNTDISSEQHFTFQDIIKYLFIDITR